MGIECGSDRDAGHQSLPSPSTFEPARGTVSIAGKIVKVGGRLPSLNEGEKLLSNTQSLCPACLRLLPAVIVERQGKVYIRKECPEHGEFEELYYGDVGVYRKFMKYEDEGKGVREPYVRLTAPCPFSCGLCPMHKNHTALANIVLTNRCNLSCWYCFFYAEAAGYVYEPSLDDIRFMVRQLKRQGYTMAVQLTGGEPTLREDLVDIIKLLREEGVRHIQLNTNGVIFAELYLKDPDEAVRYASRLREAGLNTVYLSFDGVTPKTNWKNHWEVPVILEVFRKSGMTSVVLVPTVLKSVNDHEVGAIIKFAAKHMDVVRGVNFQPVSLTGLMKKHERERFRVTIPDLMRLVEEQTEGQISREAWYPVPVTTRFSKFIEAITGREQFTMANHPLCGAATYVFVERDASGLPKRFIPVTEFVDVEGLVEYLEQRAEELKHSRRVPVALLKSVIDLRKFVDKDRLPGNLNITKLLIKVFVRRNYEALGELHYNLLYIGAMHFMDLYNYDVLRVMRCNIHYLVPDGRLIPFCAFNVLSDLYRDHIQERYKVGLEDYARSRGVVGPKYKRQLKRLTSLPLYKKAYEGIIQV